jgi:hypothetical protein
MTKAGRASIDNEPSNSPDLDTGPVQQLPETSQPVWLGDVQNLVGPNAEPERVYEDEQGRLHVVFKYNYGLFKG